MDPENRAMVLPGKSGVIVNGILRGNELPTPTSLAPEALQQAQRRSVRFTDLDVNNHMNNARYLDWAEDMLGPDFRQDHILRRATLCYLNEAKLGQMLSSCMGFDENDTLLYDLRRDKEDGNFDRIFSAVLEYDTVVM